MSNILSLEEFRKESHRIMNEADGKMTKEDGVFILAAIEELESVLYSFYKNLPENPSYALLFSGVLLADMTERCIKHFSNLKVLGDGDGPVIEGQSFKSIVTKKVLELGDFESYEAKAKVRGWVVDKSPILSQLPIEQREAYIENGIEGVYPEKPQQSTQSGMPAGLEKFLTALQEMGAKVVTAELSSEDSQQNSSDEPSKLPKETLN